MQNIVGADLGVFALGRLCFVYEPQTEITFKKDSQNLTETFIWNQIQPNLGKKSRFGRIEIWTDPLGTAQNFWIPTDVKKIGYQKTDKRAKDIPQIQFKSVPILKNMALQGYSNTVEFRRIARKFIRQAKSHKTDTIFLPESIFADETTQKVLQHLAGTQIKIITLADLWRPNLAAKTYSIKLDSDYTDYEKVRAQQLLKTKFSKNIQNS